VCYESYCLQDEMTNGRRCVRERENSVSVSVSVSV